MPDGNVSRYRLQLPGASEPGWAGNPPAVAAEYLTVLSYTALTTEW